ncbi:MAG TPA: hypothetical protein VHB50_16605 [Bryobacteraceae bacterium]|nr:hypothetical protein [Bryobacteraceae bacterium]
MRCLALALALTFAIVPMEAKTKVHTAKAKKHKVKAPKAPKRKFSRDTAN